MMRCCVPLDRVTIKGVHDYHTFATLVGLDIESDDFEKAVWHPENIEAGDSTGEDGLKQQRSSKPANATDLARTATGFDGPQRVFSFMDNIPFLKAGQRSRDMSPEGKPDRAFSLNLPFGKSKTDPLKEIPKTSPCDESRKPLHRESTAWIDAAFSPHLGLQDDPMTYEPGAEGRDLFSFNVAVLNEQSWFAEALGAAVASAIQRSYLPGVKRPKMSLEVAGYDCLATDEDTDIQGGISRRTTAASSDEGEDDDSGPGIKEELQKSEKASMAAKMFGLKEDEGIWRECGA